MGAAGPCQSRSVLESPQIPADSPKAMSYHISILRSHSRTQECSQVCILLLVQLLSTSFDLVLCHAIMLSLPCMAVISKSLELRFWYSWEHAHLDDYLSSIHWRYRLDRAACLSAWNALSKDQDCGFAYFPQVPQKNLLSSLPLNVFLSMNSFKVPFRSSILTFSSSMTRLLAT